MDPDCATEPRKEMAGTQLDVVKAHDPLRPPHDETKENRHVARFVATLFCGGCEWPATSRMLERPALDMLEGSRCALQADRSVTRHMKQNKRLLILALISLSLLHRHPFFVV